MKRDQKGLKLPKERCLEIYGFMLKSRLLEERLIRMYKQSDGYFWIGGPGEEGFNIPLGMQIHKGRGLDYDICHLHYRSAGILVPMGLSPRDACRQMKNTAKDPFSGGRNFSNHFSMPEWNVVPISSTIETQFATAIGAGIAHKGHGGTGITIVNGGDAGTAEGEFESCLIWSSRPKQELPILMIVMDNRWGISTSAETQRSTKLIADRAAVYGIKTKAINGNDPEESFLAIQEAMQYVRNERKPYLLEAKVSRLYGHSSATGCNFVSEEVDALKDYEAKLLKQGWLKEADVKVQREQLTAEYLSISQEVRQEPLPSGETIYDHVYFGQKGRYW